MEKSSGTLKINAFYTTNNIPYSVELNEFKKQTTLNLFFKRVRQVARNLQVAIFSIFLNQALILQSELGRDIEQIFFAVLVSDIQYRSNEL